MAYTPQQKNDLVTLALIERAGRLIHGDDWITKTMADIGYSRVTWHRWSKGITPIPPVGEILDKILEALCAAMKRAVAKAEEIGAEIKAIESVR